MPDDVEIEDLNENQARNQVVKLISDRFWRHDAREAGILK